MEQRSFQIKHMCGINVMSVQGFDVALQRLRVAVELEQRTIEASKQKIKSYQDAISLLSAEFSSKTAMISKISPRTRQRSHRGSAAQIIRQHVMELLLENDRPLTRAEILEGLAAKGVSLNVADPAKRVNKVMWEAAEFVHTTEGYWFAGSVPPDEGRGDVEETASEAEPDTERDKVSS